MTPARGLATVALAMLLLLGAGALIARVGSVAPPSLAECASLWNSGTNSASHRKAASSPGRLVTVDGNTNKAGQRGCTVTVLQGAGKPWVLFSTTLDQLQQVPGMWSLERGTRWGTDSPEPEKPPTRRCEQTAPSCWTRGPSGRRAPRTPRVAACPRT